ncbi:putative Aspartic proteinase nepenthesin-1 [Quillaja saponaria]|uniref:Aspartic proteinase nepenthesin-1 n=1 Tax=Quillaja saponaria TaxID=32244 RepID=A0AAD7PHJ0_QUISA|nr:putative Aspartic proteinase nepenthesin-1 [Quillaja saponaria]
MVIVFAPIHFLVLLAFSTCYFSPINTTISPIFNPPTSPITKPHKLVSKLIHPHSVHHPTYNPNDTIKDLAERDMKNSIARFAYLQAISQGSSLATNDVDLRASIFPPISGLLLANISIGQPPIPQFLVVDTGSFLLWVMCISCTNCPQHSAGPIFDPAKSSTFSTLPCQDSTCHKFLHHCHCIDLDQVAYWIKYLDNTTTAGIIAQEQLVFETSDEGTAVVPNVTFGCGYINNFRKEPQWNGILGLGSEESLVSQLGNRFSYCIGSITDSQYTYNQLVLGEGADLQGYSTPFRAINGLYYVTLQSISVGERTINIDPKTFQRNEDGSGRSDHRLWNDSD